QPWPGSREALDARLRARAPLCLPAFRQRNEGSPAPVADLQASVSSLAQSSWATLPRLLQPPFYHSRSEACHVIRQAPGALRDMTEEAVRWFWKIPMHERAVLIRESPR